MSTTHILGIWFCFGKLGDVPKHRVIQVFKKNTPEFSTCTMNVMIAMNRTGSGRPNGKESSRAQGIFPNKHKDGMNHAGRKHCKMQRLILLKHPCNTGISSFVGDMIGLTLVSSHGLHVPNALPCRAAWLFCFFWFVFGFSDGTAGPAIYDPLEKLW